MSSRFVSAGSFAVEAGTAKPAAAPISTPAPALSATKPSVVEIPGAGEKETTAQKAPLLSSSSSTTTAPVIPPQPEPPIINDKPKSKEWLQVERQLEEERLQRQRDKKAAADSSNEKTLFEVLQANKAAKQAAFEEANKIKNQFRALDDDEIDFLDEVAYKKKLEDERIRRETEEGLEGFRRAQVLGGGGEGDGEEEEELVGVFEKGGGRKRRRVGGGEGGLKGVKSLRVFGGVVRRRGEDGGGEGKGTVKGESEAVVDKVVPRPAETKTGGLGGLVDYGSSDED